MNKLTLSARSQDDDLDIVQIAPATPIFVLRESQPSDDQTQKNNSCGNALAIQNGMRKITMRRQTELESGNPTPELTH